MLRWVYIACYFDCGEDNFQKSPDALLGRGSARIRMVQTPFAVVDSDTQRTGLDDIP